MLCIPILALRGRDFSTGKGYLMFFFVTRNIMLFIIGMVLLYVCDLLFSASYRYSLRSTGTFGGRPHSGASLGYKKLSRSYAMWGTICAIPTLLCFIRLIQHLIF